ncbi:MAG TPA: response regulator, partial [Terriglobales bacterium]|nr:response regulator [Terriglobales bacterium]
FKIYLPRVDEAPTIEHSKPVKQARGFETILVVEDEEPLRALVAGFLESNGYTVLQASEGKEGIHLAQEHGQPIDLLMTDVVMPGMSGSELATAIRAFLPHVKLLFMSGYTSDLIAEHGVLENDATLLEKPFTKDSLLTKVRVALESQ